MEGYPNPDDPAERAAVAFRDGIERDRSFRTLVEAYYPRFQSFFGRRVRSKEDAQELTQETFLRIYNGLEGFRSDASFRSWAFRIAQTTFLRWIERRQRAISVVEPAPDEDGVIEPVEAVSPEQSPLAATLREEARQALAAAIGSLPEQERRCVMLRVYHDLGYAEIADLLGIKVGTTKAHLNHAREKLRQRLGDYFSGIDF